MLEPGSQRAAYDRRRFVGLAAAAGGALLLPGGQAAAAPGQRSRSLSFYNTHTHEALDIVYWRDGRYVPDALDLIDHHLRDFRTGDVRPIDCRLLDVLTELNQALANDEPLHVISGYRCPETNAMLARRSNRVAKNSYHVRGMAIDLRVPARQLAVLRDAAVHLAAGGVGYYPQSNFVHMDTGPVRHW